MGKILDRENLEKFVKGGLIQCIVAHGSIHLGWIDSATKRIIGQISPEIEDYVQSTRSVIITNLQKELEEVKRENRLLRDRLNKKRIFEHKKPIGNLGAGLKEFLE